MKLLKTYVCILLCYLSCYYAWSQNSDPLVVFDDVVAQKRWVDSVYNQMTLKEKVGQLFMVDLYSSDTAEKINKTRKLIHDYHVGGVVFSKGGPYQQARLTNEFQALAKVPLLIGMDAEWGLAMRLDSVSPFPWNMTLGAIQNDSLIEQTGRRIARNCKRLGVHMNFAPVVDINTNPKNPIIGNRSFGAHKEEVTRKSIAFMKGMHQEGVLSCAKHFPGHGDTDSDSHKTLPTINFGRERLNLIELYPYQKLMKEGLPGVMTAHLHIPSLESRPGYPTSISTKVVQGMLKDSMNFKGLILTDALNMKGAADFKTPGDIDLAAFLAGNDILLYSEDAALGTQKIVSAYYAGKVTEKRLSHSVRKILMAKYKVGLQRNRPVSLLNLRADLNSIEDELHRHALTEASLTLLKNYRAVLPVKNLDNKKIAYVSLGEAAGDVFFQELNKYAQVDWVKAGSISEINKKLRKYNYVIIGYHSSNDNPWKRFSFEDKELSKLYKIAKLNTAVLSVFSSPYAMLDVKTINHLEGILLSYQNSSLAQQKAAQILFGAIPAQGKLPVSLQMEFPRGTGLITHTMKRLSYGLPESVGLRSTRLKKIDSIMQEVLQDKMSPGVQLMVARKGKVVFQRNYGYHTYDQKQKVVNNTIYDLASLTKILATLPITMKMVDEGILSLDTRVGEMLPEFKGSNKEHITVRSMLSHYARLKAWIPFYLKTMDTVTALPSEVYYQKKSSDNFPIQVSDNLYLRKDMKDSLMVRIKDSELRRRLAYKYSDLPYYIMKTFIERYYKKSLDELTQEFFYKELGANHMGYLPLQHFEKKQIVPTEDDIAFRNQIVHGYVHDQGAAMFGGVGGHAGLFSNANDVVKMMQMYLNKGYYGGKRYLNAETIDMFNTCTYCKKKVRRGVGFDKPQLKKVGPTCGCVSMESFGHSGFTGTFAWADPVEEIVYVFLSNRTFPDASNRKLIVNDIRSEIQRIIYQSIIKEKKSIVKL